MELIRQNLAAILILSVNFITSISYFLIYSRDNLEKAFFKIPMAIQKIYVAFFVFPLFAAPFFAESKFTESNSFLQITGVVISVLGILIIGISFLKIGVVPSIKNDGKLSMTGTYRIIRHPIYFGTIATQLGLILANQASISFIYSII